MSQKHTPAQIYRLFSKAERGAFEALKEEGATNDDYAPLVYEKFEELTGIKKNEAQQIYSEIQGANEDVMFGTPVDVAHSNLESNIQAILDKQK